MTPDPQPVTIQYQGDTPAKTLAERRTVLTRKFYDAAALFQSHGIVPVPGSLTPLGHFIEATVPATADVAALNQALAPAQFEVRPLIAVNCTAAP